jgi:hypothetical protein
MRLRSLPFPLGGAIVVAFVGALLYVRPSSKYLRVKSIVRIVQKHSLRVGWRKLPRRRGISTS